MRALALILMGLWLLPAAAAARCQSIGDVMRAESAATEVVEAEGAAALNRATSRLSLRLDVLTTLYPGAEEARQSTLGAYISTRRMLPLIRQAAGRDAVRSYASDERFTGPLTVLSAPDSPADCGAPPYAGAGKPSPPSGEAGAAPLSVSAPLGEPGAGPISRVGVNFDKLPWPDFRLLIGLALLVVVIWLGSVNGRRRRRYLCNHPVEVVSDGLAEDAQALDISRAGAKLRGARVMIPGQQVEVHLGGASRIAEVRWTRDETFGVRFTRKLGVVEFFRFLAAARRGRGASRAARRPGWSRGDPRRRPRRGARGGSLAAPDPGFAASEGRLVKPLRGAAPKRFATGLAMRPVANPVARFAEPGPPASSSRRSGRIFSGA